jgi:light-independent protochlorophyllide reductase subunit B
MKLTVWTYEGPPHVGAIRVATGMEKVHLVLHAPQGDTYADLLFTMIERRNHRPPVTYTTFQARDLGSDTAGLFKKLVLRLMKDSSLNYSSWGPHVRLS